MSLLHHASVHFDVNRPACGFNLNGSNASKPNKLNQRSSSSYKTQLKALGFPKLHFRSAAKTRLSNKLSPAVKMKTILSSETMDIPEGVKIKIKAKVIEVEGPRGKLVRDFKHLNLDFDLITDEDTGKKKLKVDSWFSSRKSTAVIRTALSHVENLITGVTKGYRYKMRFVYAHFPINASITNNNKGIEIRNFLGEKKVRKVDMLDGVTILRSEKVKDEIVLDGNDIELVSRSCALINQKCHVKKKDIRKFLDGIYVSEKGKIAEEE